jgi:hypothetical protein
VYLSKDFRPLAPKFGGTRKFNPSQSPPVLGDLGGNSLTGSKIRLILIYMGFKVSLSSIHVTEFRQGSTDVRLSSAENRLDALENQ